MRKDTALVFKPIVKSFNRLLHVNRQIDMGSLRGLEIKADDPLPLSVSMSISCTNQIVSWLWACGFLIKNLSQARSQFIFTYTLLRESFWFKK